MSRHSQTLIESGSSPRQSFQPPVPLFAIRSFPETLTFDHHSLFVSETPTWGWSLRAKQNEELKFTNFKITEFASVEGGWEKRGLPPSPQRASNCRSHMYICIRVSTRVHTPTYMYIRVRAPMAIYAMHTILVRLAMCGEGGGANIHCITHARMSQRLSLSFSVRKSGAHEAWRQGGDTSPPPEPPIRRVAHFKAHSVNKASLRAETLRPSTRRTDKTEDKATRAHAPGECAPCGPSHAPLSSGSFSLAGTLRKRGRSFLCP